MIHSIDFTSEKMRLTAMDLALVVLLLTSDVEAHPDHAEPSAVYFDDNYVIYGN